MAKHYIINKLHSIFIEGLSVILLFVTGDIVAQNNAATIPTKNYVQEEIAGYSVKMTSPLQHDEKELISERTQTTKAISTGNGSVKLLSYAGPIHYQKGSKWEEIDLTILPNRSGDYLDYPYANFGNSFHSFYSSNPTRQPVITKLEDGQIISETVSSLYSFNAEGNQGKSTLKISDKTPDIHIQGDKIIYSEVFPLIDLVYSQRNVGRNFEVIIKDKQFLDQFPLSDNRIVIEEAVQIPENWVVKKEQNEINFYSNNVLIATIPQPVMRQELLGKVEYKSEAEFMLVGDISFTKKGTQVIITTTFSLEWLRDEARIYPIALDPMWKIATTNATYWTGYQTSSSAKTNGMLYMNNASYSSWAKFSIPSLSVGSNVVMVKYYGAAYGGTQTSDKFVSIRSMDAIDPVAASAVDIWKAISIGTSFTTTYRWNNPVSNAASVSIDCYTGSGALGTDANTYIQSRAGSYASFGFWEISGNTSYQYQGANNSVAPPYIEVTYCSGGDCSGTPNVGTLVAPDFACSGQNFNLTLTGASKNCGIDMQWQRATSASGPWSTIDYEFKDVLTLTQTQKTWYRVVMRCSFSGLQNTSNVVEVATEKRAFGADSYTINQGAAPTRKNFQSFTSMADSLQCHGITSAITVNVVSGSGPYNEQLILKPITGSSSSKRLTVNGNNEVLQFASSNSSNNYVFEFDQDASFYSFKNLTLRNNGTSFARIINFPKNNESVTFTNVTFQGYASATTSANHYLVQLQTNVISNYLTFDSCTFLYGSAGMYMYSSSSNGVGMSAQNLRVTDCRFIDQYYYGIFVQYYAGLQLFRNIITSTKTYSGYMGMRLYWIMCPQLDNRTYIDGNKIYYNQGGYGMYLQYLGVNTSYPTDDYFFRISNNVINIGPGPSSSILTRGIYIANQSNSEFWHNTVHVSSADQTNSAAFWFQSAYTTSVTQGKVDVANNLFTSEGNAPAFYLSNSNITPTNVTIDKNNLYSKGVNLGNYLGSFSSNIVNWRSATGYDVNSENLDPMYQDEARPNSNMHITNSTLHNKAGYMFKIPNDAEGRVRNATGTDHGGLMSIADVSISTASSVFSLPSCGRDYPIDLTVLNSGNFAFSGKLYFKIEINGGARVYLDSIPFNLSPGESKSVLMNNAVNLAGGRVNTIKISILNTDENMANNVFAFSSPYLEKSPSGSAITAVSIGSAKGPAPSDPFWKSIANETLKFSVTPPAGFTNSDYSTGYMVNTNAYEKVGGVPLPASATTYSHNPTSGGEWTLNVPDKTFDGKALIYELQFVNVISGCDSTITIEILVVDDGMPDFTTISITCEKLNTEFKNLSTVSSGYLSYKWDFGDGSVSAKPNPEHVYTNAGAYTVTLTTRTVPYGFENSITKIILIHETPDVNFSHIDKCYGQTISLTNTSTNIIGLPTYEWDLGDGNSSISKDVLVAYNQPGEYTVSLTVTTDNGCYGHVAKSVTSYANPVPNFEFPALKCMGNIVPFKNTTTIAFSNWTSKWQFGVGEGASNDMHPLYEFTKIGIAKVKLVTTSEFGCSDSIIKNVQIEHTPIINITNNDACVGYPTIFNSNVDVPSNLTATYKWNIDLVNYLDETPAVIFKYADYEVVKVDVAFSNGCQASATKRVQSAHRPKADFNVNSAVCSGQMIDLYNTTLVKFGAPKYTWNLGDGSVFVDEHAPKYIYSNNQSKDYTITLIATSPLGTCPDTFSKTVSVGVTPVCDFTVSDIYMPGHRGYEFKSVSQSGVQYDWDFGDGMKSNAPNSNHQFSRDGVYSVKLKISTPEGCSCEKIISHHVVNLGLSDVFAKSGLVIFPIPSTGVINLVNKGNVNIESIKVVNTIGSVVYFSSVNIADNSFSIDLTKNAAGVYLVQVKTIEGVILTQKIVIEK